MLVDLRNAIADLLVDQGKLDWAEQEFAALADYHPAPPRIDPWRRTSGMHRVRSRRQLATVRELWQAREQLAQRRDISPGRILPDAAIVAAAATPVASMDQLLALPGFRAGPARRAARTWWGALEAAGRLPDSALPAQSLSTDAPPPARAWADKDPIAAARLAAARAGLAELSDRAARAGREHRVAGQRATRPVGTPRSGRGRPRGPADRARRPALAGRAWRHRSWPAACPRT